MRTFITGTALKLTRGAFMLGILTAMMPAAAMAAHGWSYSAQTIYAGPGKNFPVVARIAPRASLDVQGCLEDGTWCNVFSRGKYGWVRAHNLMIKSSRHRSVNVLQAADLDRPPVVIYNTNQYWDAHYRNEPFYAMRVKYGYNAYPVPVAATGRPPYDRTGGNAFGGSAHNRIPRMIDDRIYSK